MRPGIAIALVLGVAVVVYLATRPSKVAAGNSSYGLTLDLGGLFSGGKQTAQGAPLVVPNEGTYYNGPTSILGNQLTNQSGQALTYGTD